MQFLVCRMDGINGIIRGSDQWPCIVDMSEGASADEIVLHACDLRWPGYIPKNKEFLVTRLDAAVIVKMVPRQEYVPLVRDFIISRGGMSPDPNR